MRYTDMREMQTAAHVAGLDKEFAAMREAIERMSAWLEGDCYCPCCAQTRACLPDCTLHDDDPSAGERLDGARYALFGPTSAGLDGTFDTSTRPCRYT